MKTLSIRSRIFATLAIGALSLIPVVGLAQSDRGDHGRGSSHASQSSRNAGRSQGSSRGNTGSSNRNSGNAGYTGQSRSNGGNFGSRGQTPARSAPSNQRGNFGGSQNFGSGNPRTSAQNGGRNSQGNPSRGSARAGQSFGNRATGGGSRGFDNGSSRGRGSDRGGSGFSIGIGIGGGSYYGGYSGYPRYDNEWMDIASLSGAVAYLGALSGDDTLFFAGSAGALYSLYRYDEDRNSDDPALRLRADYFSRPYFYREGRRFNRVMVNRHGERFYQFLRR